MTKLSYREWRSRADDLKAALDQRPADLDLAMQYWDTISGQYGFDVRDGHRLIATFRASALKSDAGLRALVRLFRQLFDDCGELPRPALFDPPLENLLRLVARQPSDSSAEEARWILSFLEPDE